MNRAPDSGGFYYVEPGSVGDGVLGLSKEESLHATRVMRLGPGDRIPVTDGLGTLYECEIVETGRKGGLVARILSKETGVGDPGYELTVGLGVLRNAGRFETAVEKLVELGTSTIAPILTDRTQKASVNRNRCERLAVAAMKQSMRTRIPDILETQTLQQFLDAAAHGQTGLLKLIAHEGTGPDGSLLALAAEIRDAPKLAVLIGPEGGFSDAELAAARSSGWRETSLGPSRLRAETAAISAASVIQLTKAAWI